MIQLAITRHGYTKWNLEKRYQGLIDIPLCDEGIQALQNKRVPSRFDGYDLFCSPLCRTRETLELLTDRSYKVDEGLIECDYGGFQGLTREEIEAKYPIAYKCFEGLDYTERGGETLRQVQQRIVEWALSLKRDSFAVSHKGVIMTLFAHCLDWDIHSKRPEKYDSQKILLFEIKGNKISLVEKNIEFEEKV